MIGKTDIGDLEIGDPQAVTMEDEVNLAMRGMAGMGGDVGGIGIRKSGCGQEEFKLPAPPEGVEISADNHRLADVFDQMVEMLQLILPVPVFQGEMDDKKDDLLQIPLDDQAFNSLIEIVQGMVENGLFGEQGVGLHPQDRDPVGKRIIFIFCRDNMGVSQPFGNGLRLAEIS